MKKIFYTLVILGLGLNGLAQDSLLWYRQPARKWTEALPIGNGRIGAMIYGGVGDEHLQFNESTLWSGRPRDFARPDAYQYLGPIRQLLSEGKQDSAERLATAHFMGLQDPDPKAYGAARLAWLAKVRRDTGWAATGLDDQDWATMTIPTPDGWEDAGLQGLDGAVWFRVNFDLPDGWDGKDLVLDLGRIRDMDYCYVNGVLVGADEGISKKRSYKVKGSLLRPKGNVLAIQVINFDDKGGLIGYKGNEKMAIGGSVLPVIWKYKIQDMEAPLLPKYEADYQPFGDLYFKFLDPAGMTDYRRELDIARAVASVSYSVGGVRYKREYFASEPQQVLVSRLTADKAGSVNVEASLGAVHRGAVVRKIDDHTIALSVKVRNGVLKGESWLRVNAVRGRVSVVGDKIVVKGADAVVFCLAAATSFVNYHDVSGDPAARCREVLSKVGEYKGVLAAHEKEYRGFYDRFSVDLGGRDNGLPTDERIVHFSPESDPGLLALYMQYARYLLISCSRPSSPMPANLQGMWNPLLSPPWGSKYTTNINLQMNYWPVEVLNLSDCAQPLWGLMRDLSVTGQQTAQRNYKASGWVLHHNTDIWRATAPINASNHGIWQTGGAWLCHNLWDHYCYTMDIDFLKEYYPVMAGAAHFYIDVLVKDPKTGWLISTPSNSPEHGGLVAGPTMDHQIIRDLFKNCISARNQLRLYPEFQHELREKYQQIAPNQIGRFGQLQEWMEDKDDTADTHRHISHLWGVYPGTDITWKDPAMMKAARQSLIYRGDEGTGWSLAWKVNCWARFREGDHALRLVDKLLSDASGTQGGEKGGVYPNMFDAHPPFQIDGNFGGAAGISELLLQSQDSVIELLPALPTALANGAVRGICARGGFVLDMRWSQGVLQRVDVLSKAGGTGVFKYGERVVTLRTDRGKWYHFDGQLKAIL